MKLGFTLLCFIFKYLPDQILLQGGRYDDLFILVKSCESKDQEEIRG